MNPVASNLRQQLRGYYEITDEVWMSHDPASSIRMFVQQYEHYTITF